MFVWTSGFQMSLVHQDFDIFVDKRTSVNGNPATAIIVYNFPEHTISG